MTRVSRLTQTIRDVADAAGTAQPAALLKATRMDRHALVRAIGGLARRGLVTIDKASGAVSLTPAGRASLAEAGGTIEAGAQARPAGYALLPDATAAARPAARGGDRQSGSKRAALPAPVAVAAVKQIKDVAVAIRRRRVGKKPAAVETSSRTRDAGPGRKPKAKRAAPGVDDATPKKRAKPAAARSGKSKSTAKGETSRRGMSDGGRRRLPD